VLGCLVEKQLTTPQQYPLTLNALATACSQATNREPVLQIDEDAVMGILQSLKEQHLVRFVLPSHGRSVTRYRQVLDEVQGLETPALALLSVLLLRGPQTTGELRARTARMAEFSSVDEVQRELDSLAGREDALVALHPRRPGQKEDRWGQCVAAEWGASGDPAALADPADDRAPGPGSSGQTSMDAPPTTWSDPVEDGRGANIDELRNEVAALRQSLADLAETVAQLRHDLGS
jgi:uncharacterized protein